MEQKNVAGHNLPVFDLNEIADSDLPPFDFLKDTASQHSGFARVDFCVLFVSFLCYSIAT